MHIDTSAARWSAAVIASLSVEETLYHPPKALELDPSVAEVQFSKALYLYYFERSWRELRKYEGMNFVEIGKAMGRDPRNVAMDLAIADRAESSVIISIMHEDDVRAAMRHPLISFGTDSAVQAEDGKLTESKSHARARGTLPRILGRYVHAVKLLTARGGEPQGHVAGRDSRRHLRPRHAEARDVCGHHDLRSFDHQGRIDVRGPSGDLSLFCPGAIRLIDRAPSDSGQRRQLTRVPLFSEEPPGVAMNATKSTGVATCW